MEPHRVARRKGNHTGLLSRRGSSIVFQGPEGPGDHGNPEQERIIPRLGGLAMSADLMQDINGLIGIWQPRKTYHIGPNYLDDLKRFLQEKLITPKAFFSGKKTAIEFVDGKGMDIGVKRKVGPSVEAVGIVMKRDLATLADLKLLMEQINLAERNYQEMFVILMGTLTNDMEGKLGAFLANKGATAKITVVKK
jgi:hypothetical protein